MEQNAAEAQMCGTQTVFQYILLIWQDVSSLENTCISVNQISQACGPIH